MSKQVQSKAVVDTATDRTPRYRSGAAARLAGMPVNTLRIWERRYAVVRPPKSPSGQRLYSDADVHRLMCLRALVDQGHAIGTIAHLDLAELERMLLGRQTQLPAAATPALRLFCVGPSLPSRLAALGGGPAWQVLQHLDVLPSTEARPEASAPVDVLLVQIDSLQSQEVDAVFTLAEHCQARQIAVIYAFGTLTAAESLRLAGVRVYREPVTDIELRQVLQDFAHGHDWDDEDPRPPQWIRSANRFTDEQLGLMAGLSTTIACECPRHLASLIMQLSAFERYSDTCTSRSATDAALHRHLGDVSNRARAMFEAALERLAQEEGWDLFNSSLPLPTRQTLR